MEENKYEQQEKSAKKAFVIAFIIASIIVQAITVYFLSTNGGSEDVLLFILLIEAGGEGIGALFAVMVMAMLW